MSSSSRGMEPDLVLLPNWLGDVVMAFPALAHLKAKGSVIVAGAGPLVELVSDLGLADDGVVYDRRGKDHGPQGLWRAARRCARHHPQRVYVFSPSLRAALLAFLAGVRHRRGHPTDGRGLFLNERVLLPRPPRSRHQSDVWLAMVEGTEVRDGAARIRTTAGERGREEWRSLSRRQEGKRLRPGAFAVLAPAVRYGPAKEWPLSHFSALAQKISKDFGWPVVTVGSGAGREAELCSELTKACGGIDLSGRTSLPALAALLAEAALFVGNDSGPAQLAAVVGTPTVTVFGSTSPAWTAPRGERSLVAGPHPVSCTPCFRRECPIGLPCLEELSVEEVWEIVLKVLEEMPRPDDSDLLGTSESVG